MNAKISKVITIFTIILLAVFLFKNFSIFALSNNEKGNIDIFTQKKPYDGKGPNISSDAFAPQESVILYALVTFDGNPKENLLVAFDIKTPSNKSFSLSATTNRSGIAKVDFRILQPPIDIKENEVFGVWNVIGNVLIGNKLFQDSMSFKVGYIVELISAKTIDEKLEYRSSFGKGGDVGIELALMNIAMVIKNVTIAIVIQDCLQFVVNSSLIRDLKITPNEKLVFIYFKLQLPSWAYTGNATIYVSALTEPISEGGIPYCPEISTNFNIVNYNPIRITFHDVAVVDVISGKIEVERGESLNIQIIVGNEGTQIENFSVQIYFNDTLVESLYVTKLQPYSNVFLNLNISTSHLDIGKYVINVSIPVLLNETDLTDNTFIDGIVEIVYTPPPPPWYYLSVKTEPAGIVLIPGEGWYIEGEQVNLSAPSYLSVQPYIRYKFVYWAVDGIAEKNSTVTLIMDANHTLIAYYKLQYYMTVISPYGSPIGQGWYDSGAYAYVGLNTNIVDHGNGTRRIFTHWSGDAQCTNYTRSAAILMDGPKIAVANWKTQYFLSVKTDPPDVVTISGEGWYDEFSNVTLYAPAISSYVFNYWDVDGVLYDSKMNLIEIYMDGAKIATAHYNKISPKAPFFLEWFYYFLLLILFLILITLIILLIYRRKRKKNVQKAFHSGWTAWYYRYNLQTKTAKL